MQGEIWKPMPGWEGLYEVSNMGRMRSLPRELEKRRTEGKVLSGRKTEQGFVLFQMKVQDRRQMMTAHRAVLLAFRGKPKYGQIGVHLSGDRGDNRLENLKWGYALEKARKGREGGAGRKAKLKQQQVLAIFRDPRKQKEIAAEFGVCTAEVNHIKRGRAWAWLTQASGGTAEARP
jgi:hypothetical protein